MRSTVPALLFCMTAPVTQVVELRSLHVLLRQEAAPSIVGALFGRELPPSIMRGSYAGQATWLMETQDARPVLQEIESYAGLEPGWDGGEGRPGLRWSVDAAVSFAASLSAEIPDPVPMLSSSGEVGIYWMRGGAYAEIGFDQTGTCFLFAEAPGMVPVHLDDMSPDDPAVLAALRDVLDLTESVPLAA